MMSTPRILTILILGWLATPAFADHGGATHVDFGLSVPATSSTGDYTVTWNGGSYIVLEEKVGSGPYVRYSGYSGTKSYTGKADGTYTYRIVSIFCYYSCSYSYSEPQSIVVSLAPNTPANIQGPASDDDGQYSLTWGASAGATGYPLQRRMNGGAWSEIQSNAGISYSESLSIDGTYEYRVSACSGASCSGWTPNHTVVVSTAGGVGGPPPVAGPKPDPGPSASSDRIGTIEGEFRVTETGAATYSIPIQAAAGTAGVAPEFSLNYSSSAGNGIAGVGWSLGGLSAISRCRQTYAQDRNPLPIDWSADDRFCLDGQRLVPHPAGQNYGDPNTTYRTEIDSGAIVTIRGNANGEPDYFEVRRKDGSTSYYGKSPHDSGNESAKYGAGPGKTLTWAIRHFMDSYGDPATTGGNPIWYDYVDGGEGHRIKEVRWGFGTGRGPTAGYGARVVFEYDVRADRETGYIAGSFLSAKSRLTEIHSYNVVGFESPIRQYYLSYDNSSSLPDKLSRLKSIEECVGNVCLPETTFEWRIPSGIRASSYMGFIDMDGNYKGYTPADINGDGLMDWVWKKGDGEGKKLKYVFATGSSFAPQTFSNGSTQLDIKSKTDAPPLQAIDYNLDGRQDIAYYDTQVDVWKILLSEPTGSGSWKLSATPITTPLSFPHHDDAHVVFTDVDSNGTTDAVYKDGPNDDVITVRKLERNPNEPDSSSTPYHFGSMIFPAGFYASEMVGEGVPVTPDFNGDGQVDLVIAGNDWNCSAGYWNCTIVNNNRRLVLANGFATDNASVTSYANFFSSAWMPLLQTPDVNGDGLSDVFFPVGYKKKSGNSSAYYLYVNRGNGTFQYKIYVNDAGLIKAEANPKFVDWNMDGYPDLVWNDVSGAGAVYARYWNPQTDNLDPAVVISYTTTGANKERVYYLDANGDAAPDIFIVNYNGNNGDIRVYTRKVGSQLANVAANRIEKITDGLTADTQISYEPLSYTDHYERLEVDTTTETATHCEGEPGVPPFCYDVPVQAASPGAFYTAINGDWDVPVNSQYLPKTSPVLEVSGPVYVVTDTTSAAPTAAAAPGDVNAAARRSARYYYKEAKMQAAGRGFLGFEQVKVVDATSGIEKTTRFRQDWPFTGMPIGTAVTSQAPYQHSLSNSSSTWEVLEWNASTSSTAENDGTAALGSIHVVQVKHAEDSYDLVGNGASAGNQLSRVLTETTYDIESNATKIKVTTTDSAAGNVLRTVETTNTYDGENFPLFDARLDSTKVVTVRPALDTTGVTRFAEFAYYLSGPQKGLLSKEIVEPYRSDFRLETVHSYDSYGNRNRSAITGGGETRCDVDTVEYGVSGRYVDRSYDCLGYLRSEVMSRDGFGQPTQIDVIVDAVDTSARMPTYIYYGALGREYFRTSQDGASKTVYVSEEPALCPASAVYKVATGFAGGGALETCYDALGRELRSSTRGFDGQWDAVDTEYDAEGRVKHRSEPFDLVSGSQIAPHWSTLSYDLLGRATYADLPGDAVSSTTYDGLKMTQINPLGQRKAEYRNVLGELVRVVDHLQGDIVYTYDHLGSLSTTTQNSTVTVTTEFNDLRQKIRMNDPDLSNVPGGGDWTYEYNNFGELEMQTDAKLQTSEMTYDGLGRMKTRINRTSSDDVESHVIWTYDTAPNGLGQLDSVLDMESGYMRALSYDDLGRIDEVTTNFDASAYFEKTTYDGHGRVYQVYDAAGDGSFTDHGIVNQYNAFGHLNSVGDVVEVGGQPRKLYWRINAINARGQVVDEDLGVDQQNNVAVNTLYAYYDETGLPNTRVSTSGSGTVVQDLLYEWDYVGNLKKRQSTGHGVAGNTTLTETFAYDDLNRLRTQSVTGQPVLETTYDLLGNIETKTGIAGTYGYGNGAGPHAVTSIGSRIYSYDKNGNNTGDSFSGRSIEWTTFNKPSSITRNGHTTSFAYGPERARYRRIDDYGAEEKTTRYIGNVEIITLDANTVQRKRYVAGVAVETGYYTNGTETSRDTGYLLKDHLGSSAVFVDEAGSVEQELSFGAWGQRRDPDNWQELDSNGNLIDLGPGFNTDTTTQGFTGHEMLDDVGIIHMNGRIYDPFLGRFLQADPIVQDPDNTQSLNRYSYVMNNPLSATDPSGFEGFSIGDLFNFSWWAVLINIAIDLLEDTGPTATPNLNGTFTVIGTSNLAFSENSYFDSLADTPRTQAQNRSSQTISDVVAGQTNSSRTNYENGAVSKSFDETTQTDEPASTGDGIVDIVFGPPVIGDETPEEKEKVNDMVEPVSLGDAAFFDTLLNCRPFLVCKVRMDEIEDALEADGDKKKKRPKPLPVKILIEGLEELGKVQVCDIANRPACDGTTPGVGTRPSRERTDAIILGIELGKAIGAAGRGRDNDKD